MKKSLISVMILVKKMLIIYLSQKKIFREVATHGSGKGLLEYN